MTSKFKAAAMAYAFAHLEEGQAATDDDYRMMEVFYNGAIWVTDRMNDILKDHKVDKAKGDYDAYYHGMVHLRDEVKKLMEEE